MSDKTTTKPKSAQFCIWDEDEWTGAWDTRCGSSFQIVDGTPADNLMRFCCYCGRPIEQALAKVKA